MGRGIVKSHCSPLNTFLTVFVTDIDGVDVLAHFVRIFSECDSAHARGLREAPLVGNVESRQQHDEEDEKYWDKGVHLIS